MECTNVKYLIIGAGISGLTFANYIKDNYLIVEKESEVGGYCRTIKKGDYDENFNFLCVLWRRTFKCC